MRRPCTWLKHFAPILLGVLIVGRLGAQDLDAYLPNYNEGYRVGYASGYDTGYTLGGTRGTNEGMAKGNSDGYLVGWNASYQPAYDAAYQLNVPLGQAAGWQSGIRSGFDEGYEKAYETYGIFGGSISCIVNSIAFNPNLLSLTNRKDSSGDTGFQAVVLSAASAHDIDWAAVYYKSGYDTGNKEGLGKGSKDGYDTAYPIAYASAFEIGNDKGTSEGTAKGTSAGTNKGFSVGWNQGYDPGYDLGYDAGYEYFRSGSLTLSDEQLAILGTPPTPRSAPKPSYAVVGLQISAAQLSYSVVELQSYQPVLIPVSAPLAPLSAAEQGVPEPATATLFAIALTTLRRRRRRKS